MIVDIVMWKPNARHDHPKHVAARPFIGAVRLERPCMDDEA
jgi:hypothetical protein